MLTIKHIDERYETLQEARFVTYYAAEDNATDGKPAQLFIESVTGDVREVLDSGTYYVMNENGQTIGRYFMTSPKEPSGPSQIPSDLAAA